METLPSGVRIREFYSPDETREELLRRVRDEMIKRFPIENDKVRIELDGAEYDQKKLRIPLEDQVKAILTGGRLSVPLRGRMRLVDKTTNTPIDEKDILLANVPYMNDDGAFVIGGTQYITSNQSRLKPGIYARTKDNGELETHFNVAAGTGASMRFSMEPETGVFRANVDKSSIKLYPVLKALGVSDEDLEKSWGPEILKKNQEAWDKNAFNKFYGKLLRNRAVPDASDDEKIKQVTERLAMARFDPEVTTRTLGEPHETLTPATMVRAATKLLRINQGAEEEDDRDHPANRTFHSVDDFMADRIRLDSGKLARNLLYKATYDRSLKHMSPGYFTPQLEGLIVSNQLSQVFPGLNPMEIYDQHNRVIQLGEGGVSCFSADTEVLTESGWKRWPDVTQVDKLACRINDVLEFHHPIRLFCGFFGGEMLAGITERINYLVTPNHRFWVSNPKCNRHTKVNSWSDFKFRTAESVHGKMVRHLVSALPYQGGVNADAFVVHPAPIHGKNRGSATDKAVAFEMRDWAAFLGFWLADGSFCYQPERREYRLEIGKYQKKNPEEHADIQACLVRLGVTFRYEQGRRFVIHGKHLAHYFSQFGHSADKFVPDYIMKSGPEVRKRFLEAIWMDSSKQSQFSREYSSASSRMAEQVGWLAISLGHSVVYKNMSRPGRPRFGVLIQFNKTHAQISAQRDKKQYQKVHYQGDVFCAEVPGNLLFVRREGKTFWSGNSMESIPVASRNLQAAQLGLIDPIRSSESMSIGVDQRFTIAARKGDDGHVYYPARNLKSGKVEYVNPVGLYSKTMAFAKPLSLKPFRSVIASPAPVAQPVPVPPPVATPEPPPAVGPRPAETLLNI